MQTMVLKTNLREAGMRQLARDRSIFVPIAPHFPPLVHTHHFELSHDTFIALALEFNITTVYHFYSGSDPKGTIYTFHMYLGSNVEVFFWTVYEGFLND